MTIENEENFKAPIADAESSELGAFRQEIRALKDQEAINGKTSHFNQINPDRLTDEDREMWEKVKALTIGLKKFDEYKQAMIDNGEIGDDRKSFAGYLSNYLAMNLATLELTERRRSMGLD